MTRVHSFNGFRVVLFLILIALTNPLLAQQHELQLGSDVDVHDLFADTSTHNVGFTQGHHDGMDSGDLNGDGIDDLVIGAAGRLEPNYVTPLDGEVFVKFGGIAACGQSDLADPSDIDLHITGSDAEDMTGWSVLVADLNGDSQDDLLVSAYFADGPTNSSGDVGAVYAFFGPLSAGTLDVATDADWTLHGGDSDHPVGNALAVGDISGDGVPDLAVGAPGIEVLNVTIPGEAHVIFGPFAAGSRDLATQPADIEITGHTARALMGYSLEIADLTGDGTQDLVVAAIGAKSLQGEVYTFFGPLSASSLSRADADVQVEGQTTTERLGFGLSVADLNDDGQWDLAMASRLGRNPQLNNDYAGGAAVLYGPFSTGTQLLKDQTDLLIHLSRPGQALDVSSGDVSGDGIDDLIIAAPFKGPNNTQLVDGELEILLGPLGSGVRNLTSDPAEVRVLGLVGSQGQLGRAVTIADLTGDGKEDLAVTASFAFAPGGQGHAYLIDGPIGFEVTADPVPACVSASPATVAGSADSENAIDTVEALVNGGSTGTVCLGCGVDPTFSFDFPLQACDNTLRFEATDSTGQIGVKSRKTRLDADGPSFNGCADIEIEVPEGATGTAVSYEPDSVDGCDGSLPSTCSIPSGTFFGLGVTQVSCTSTDTCGNASTCDFRVIVETETADNTECRSDDFADPLSAIWTLDVIGDATQQSAQTVSGELHLTGTGTSLYHGTDNAAFLHQNVTGDFFFEVEITDIPVDAGGQYRKGGLKVRTGLGDTDPRVMVQLVPHFPKNAQEETMAIQFDYRGTDGVTLELASTVQDISLPVRLAISRRGDELTAYFARQGEPWTKPAGSVGGSIQIPMGQTVLAGLDVASYDAAQPFTMAFDNASICTPNDVDPGPVNVGCNATQALDVIYLLDMSGSMARPFDGTTKLEASRQAIHRLNDTFATLTDGSRGALITYSLPNGSSDAGLATTVVSPFTTNFEALSDAAETINFGNVLPLDSSPTALAISAVEQLLQGSGDPTHRPVLIWMTDNLPNVDDELFGGVYYTEAEVRALSLLDGNGDFLTRGEVAWLGNENYLPDGSFGFDGEVMADTMAGLESLMETFPETRILGAVARDDGSSSPVISEDLLDYAAYLSDGDVFGGIDTMSLEAAMNDLLAAANCGLAGNASIAGEIWRDLDADGLRTAGENGVFGVDIELLDGSQTVLATATTGTSGRYAFIAVPPGTYEVRVDTTSLPSELTIATADRDGVGTAHSFTATVASYDAIVDGDFGYGETAVNVTPLNACFTDDFADGVLEADWRSTYLGDADQGTYDESAGTLKLSGDGTTLFGTSDNGHYLYRHVNGNFRAELDIVGFPVDQGGDFRKAGLMVRDGFDPSAPRVMVQYVPHWAGGTTPALQLSYRDVGIATDDLLATNVDNLALPIRVAIERIGDVFTVEYSTDDGTTWIQPTGELGGSVTIAMDPITSVGMDVVSYDAALTLTAEMDGFSLCPAP